MNENDIYKNMYADIDLSHIKPSEINLLIADLLSLCIKKRGHALI